MKKENNNKKYLVMGGLLLLAVLAVLFSTQLTGKVSKNTPPPASIQINSEPTNSDVWIDGTEKGNTPKLLSLDSGEHYLVVSRVGYEDYVDTITLTTGRNEPLNIVLVPSE